MQSLFLSSVFLSLMIMGFSAAFGAALGFIWVDLIKPQSLAYSIIAGQPLSFIAALFMLGQYLLNDRKSPPKFGALLTLIVIFAFWVTLTTNMSTIPGHPWEKWDWVIKVLIFAVLLPFFFRSRIQIEAFILVFIFSAATIFVSAGAKTVLGGGGYGVLAVMGGGNSGLAESSTLAMVCVMLIPLVIYVMRHNLLLPKNWLFTLLFIGIIVSAVASIVGTSARTGLISLGVLYVLLTLKSKKKGLLIGAALLAGAVVLSMDMASTTWGSRMSTIETYDSDSSALGRLAVWKWTIGYVQSHPLGGGFDAYAHNRISTVTSDGVIIYYPDWRLAGKAFHSIYFEVLGEQGIPGFVMYLAMIIITLRKLSRLKKQWRDHMGMTWLSALADALINSITVFLVGGSFVGIAYQPYIFYMIGLTVAIDQYSARVEKELRLKKLRERQLEENAAFEFYQKGHVTT